MPTILLVENHDSLAGLLADYLNRTADLAVQDVVASRQEALAILAQHPPDVLVLDVKLSDGCGLALCPALARCRPAGASLVFSAYDEDAYLARAWAGGASGYLLKTEPVTALTAAIRRAAAGERLWTPYQELRVQHWQRVAGDKWAALTEREREIVASLVHFKTDAEIAEELKLSLRTVNNHLRHIREKLKLDTRWEVARWAVKHKLVDEGE